MRLAPQRGPRNPSPGGAWPPTSPLREVANLLRDRGQKTTASPRGEADRLLTGG